jgi:hypothetical protein
VVLHPAADLGLEAEVEVNPPGGQQVFHYPVAPLAANRLFPVGNKGMLFGGGPLHQVGIFEEELNFHEDNQAIVSAHIFYKI